jgi:hypothetical protein
MTVCLSQSAWWDPIDSRKFSTPCVVCCVGQLCVGCVVSGARGPLPPQKAYTHNQSDTYTPLPTNGPHQQIRVLQRGDEGEVALPRREHVEQELVERDGQRLERGRVAVDELCFVVGRWFV